MAPLALAAVWFGAPWLTILILLVAAGMGWEWARMSGARSGPASVSIVVAILAAVTTLVVASPLLAIAVALAGSVLVWRACRATAAKAPLSSAAGMLWIAVPCVALLWLDRDGGGRITIFWLLGVVWASDIGAYAFGRTIGGPKLAPALSPNKTWSGALGGLFCAGLVGFGAAWFSAAPAAFLAAISVGLAIVAELGDLAESALKRKFGVKDSGALIPGHGGLLDRLDSLLTAAPAQALVIWLAGGSLLDWRL
jgi:phosphatidate cytidylyltransferase